MKKIVFGIAMLAVLGTSCKKEYQNPNAPTQEQVLSSTDGLTKLLVGIKFRYAVSATANVYSTITAAGLSTGEATVLNAGNADLAQLQNGGTNLAPNNAIITVFWTTANVINSECDKLINNLGVVGDVPTKNSLQAYAHLYKALVLGNMATFWEQVTVKPGPNAGFVSRREALTQAIALLDAASTLMNTTTIPAAFTTQVGADVDLKNTLLAISARYNNMLGNHDAAIAKAAAVDLTKRSFFFYNTINPNPVFRSSLTTNNVYGIVNNFGLTGALAPNVDDKRIAFHLTRNATNGSGFFKEDPAQIPVYLPGEMLLIQAEANARKNSLPTAINLLNQVLTKTTDAWGLGAALPTYSGDQTQPAVLQEIYKNRCIELYMSGFKLEDSRRFGRPGPGQTGPERTRNFYPYPQQERDGNSSTPADPQN